jgi:muramoyltetrapeptide carboxypeptidase LdcA involved in peptidoglycan recycling
MEKTYPETLKKGDTIAIIAPSAGLAAIFPHRLDNAIKYLKSQGYNIKEFSCTRKINGWESASAEKRARDIMDAFLDKEVKAIICEIGGNTINKTLKYLDFEKINENPKILCGYSDIAVLHYAINKKCNFLTFYGPCAMTQFAEFPKPLDYTLEYFNKAVVDGKIGEIKPSEKWTDEVLDWGEKKDLDRPREMKENKGFEWLKKGQAKGEIIGGLFTLYYSFNRDRILARPS